MLIVHYENPSLCEGSFLILKLIKFFVTFIFLSYSKTKFFTKIEPHQAPPQSIPLVMLNSFQHLSEQPVKKQQPLKPLSEQPTKNQLLVMLNLFQHLSEQLPPPQNPPPRHAEVTDIVAESELEAYETGMQPASSQSSSAESEYSVRAVSASVGTTPNPPQSSPSSC